MLGPVNFLYKVQLQICGYAAGGLSYLGLQPVVPQFQH